jgi:hypothetical protein
MVKRGTALRQVDVDDTEQRPLASAPLSFTAPDAVAADTMARFGDDPDLPALPAGSAVLSRSPTSGGGCRSRR